MLKRAEENCASYEAIVERVHYNDKLPPTQPIMTPEGYPQYEQLRTEFDDSAAPRHYFFTAQSFKPSGQPLVYSHHSHPVRMIQPLTIPHSQEVFLPQPLTRPNGVPYHARSQNHSDTSYNQSQTQIRFTGMPSVPLRSHSDNPTVRLPGPRIDLRRRPVERTSSVPSSPDLQLDSDIEWPRL